jgi:hypothetical protein
MSLLNGAVLFATTAFTERRFQPGVRRARPVRRRSCRGDRHERGRVPAAAVLLVRAFVGHVRGLSEVRGLVSELHLGTALVVYDLGAPFALMVNFLDKYLIGTALGYGYLLMLLALWGALRWLAHGRRDGLAWVFMGAAGTMFIHGVVGLSVIPVAAAATGLALLLRFRFAWLPAPGRLLALGIAFGAGGLVAAPYMASVASGWAGPHSGAGHSFVGFDPFMLWTVITALGVVLCFAAPAALAAWRERRPIAVWVALYLAGMVVFAMCVRLPEENQMRPCSRRWSRPSFARLR